MRRLLATAVLGAVLGALVGCSTGSAGATPKIEPPLPLAAPKGMAEMTPAQYAVFHPIVNRYFYVRKQAVLAGDPAVVWREFPALKEGYDGQAGINAEADAVGGYKSLTFIDGNMQPESYARLKAQADGDRAVVLVNGSEVYLHKDFSESGGQVQVMLYLEKTGDGWTVVKTDETTLAEYHQALKR
ncbi:MAG: exported protein of unknown function [Symbiobacteriaceae bacterium]|jgi:hypothetical protein|nr:exported protein of unknown function [Symbiobacteriaceae bacterium]